MMPSRGLYVTRGISPRVFQLQCRDLSFASRRAWQSRQILPSSPSYRSTLQRRGNAPIALTIASSVRHASTTPSPPPTAATSPSQDAISTPPPTSDFPNLDTITIDVPNLVSGIPERIGYLHEIGINYGWGPTSMIQSILEHFHIWGHLPWWGAIAATAITLRLILFPFYLKASDSMARQNAIMSVTKPISQRMTEAQREGDQEKMIVAWRQMNAIKKSAGVSLSATLTPVFLQAVIGFCGFRLMRACAVLPVPGFQTGGFAHLMDLTVTDPYLILPAAMALTIHLMIRLGGETGSMNQDIMSPAMKNTLLYAMPVGILFIMGWQPGALCVWFASTGAMGMIQALLFQRPAVRRFFGIAPLYKPSKEEAAAGGPLAAMMDAMKPTPRKEQQAPRRPTIDVGVGKNVGYMNPTWQAPNLHTRAGGNRSDVIDVVATTPSRSTPVNPRRTGSDEMVSPSSPKADGGVVGSVKGYWKEAMDRYRNYAENSKEQQRKKRMKAQADAYERRAKERGR